MTDATRACKLDIFLDLEPDELDELVGLSTRITARQGRILYMPEETGEVLLFVQEGSVQIYRISPEGKKFIIDNLGAGAVFGEMALIGHHMHSSFAQALEDSVLCLIRRDDLERLLLDKPKVALRILGVLGKRLSEAEKKLEDMAFRSVAARLASLLLRLSRDDEDTIDGLSHQELAEMIGTYRETVTQTLSQFKASKLVDIQRKSIRILRPEELVAIARNGS
jgi:CRP/FNR family cyclic AMP-dependent transcriptional regulator